MDGVVALDVVVKEVVRCASVFVVRFGGFNKGERQR